MGRGIWLATLLLLTLSLAGASQADVAMERPPQKGPAADPARVSRQDERLSAAEARIVAQRYTAADFTTVLREVAAVFRTVDPNSPKTATLEAAVLGLQPTLGDSPTSTIEFLDLLSRARLFDPRSESDPNLRLFYLQVRARSELHGAMIQIELSGLEITRPQYARALAAARAFLAEVGSNAWAEKLAELDVAQELWEVEAGIRDLFFVLTDPSGKKREKSPLYLQAQAGRAWDLGETEQAARDYARVVILMDDAPDDFSAAARAGARVDLANALLYNGDCIGAEEAVRDLQARFKTTSMPHHITWLPSAILAECALLDGRTREAWELANDAIAAMAGQRADELQLDLRERYRQRDGERVDPREVAIVAAALLLVEHGYPGEGELPASPEALLDQIVRLCDETRNSSLADAIRLRQAWRGGGAQSRAAIEVIFRANEQMDMARRAFARGEPGADQRGREAEATLAAARLAVTDSELVRALEPVDLDALRTARVSGEGLIFLHASPFGLLAWGLDGSGAPLVDVSQIRVPWSGQESPPAQGWDRLRVPPELRRRSAQDLLRVPTAAELSNFLASGSGGTAERRSAEERLRRTLETTSWPIEAVFAPLLGKADRWVIMHSDQLDGAPFAQARFGRSTFGETIAYSIAPSPGALVALRSGKVDNENRRAFVGLGDVPFAGCERQGSTDGGVGGSYGILRQAILAQACLEATGLQVRTMGSLLAPGRGDISVGPRASEATLNLYARKPLRVLVLASHAVPPNSAISDGWPALLLYPPRTDAGSSDDGRLTSYEAAKMGFDVDLVVLSACSTGTGDTALGEEPLAGLAKGFMQGGARSVLLSRWTVRLDVAVAMNTAFARSLSRGASRAEALRQARRVGAKLPGVSVWDWTAFELVGEGGVLP